MSQNPLDALIPIHTRSQPIRTDEVEYFRNDPSILLMNHQDPLHIINPEYERGGINTRDFVKRVHGTSLENTIRNPLCNNEKEPQPIKPEHIKMLGKDSPFLTYLDSRK
jgi:hypothetical protein